MGRRIFFAVLPYMAIEASNLHFQRTCEKSKTSRLEKALNKNACFSRKSKKKTAKNRGFFWAWATSPSHWRRYLLHSSICCHPSYYSVSPRGQFKTSAYPNMRHNSSIPFSHIAQKRKCSYFFKKKDEGLCACAEAHRRCHREGNQVKIKKKKSIIFGGNDLCFDSFVFFVFQRAPRAERRDADWGNRGKWKIITLWKRHIFAAQKWFFSL